MVLTKGAALAVPASPEEIDMKVNKRGLVACEMLKSAGGYNKGEIAGFAPEVAQRMIDSKVAKEHTGKAPARDKPPAGESPPAGEKPPAGRKPPAGGKAPTGAKTPGGEGK